MRQVPVRVRSARRSIALAGAILLLATSATPSVAEQGNAGFRTRQPSMLTALAPGSSATPIISVGDRLPGGYRFEAIPDGIAVHPRGNGRLDVYVNHETSLVPFPYNPADISNNRSLNDFDNAQISRLALHQKTAGVLHGSIVLPSSANYQRFCSNFIAGPEHGFDRPTLFANEEATDIVNRVGPAWPARPNDPAARAEQAGVVVAYDLQTGKYRTIYGLGRLNHENTVALPGYRQVVLLTGDDTFAAPSSQMYMYLAPSGDAVWNDRGHLWAFRSDVATVNDYGDLSGSAGVSGRFIPVPDSVARGDQTALENWSNANNVFQFIRVEDIAYDRNAPNVVYFADTGEPRALPDPATGRLRRGPSSAMGPYPNGRIFRMELDRTDPTRVARLSILIDGDPGGPGNPAVIHQPDNLETTARSLLIQEDPGGHNQYTGTEPGATNARVWRYDLSNGSLSVVAAVNQSADPGARLGAWESSGIVDASRAFGPGSFLLDVEAHTLFVETAPGPDLVAPAGPDWIYKREGGQVLLLRIPGA